MTTRSCARETSSEALHGRAMAILTDCAQPPRPQRTVCARRACGAELTAARVRCKVDFCSIQCRHHDREFTDAITRESMSPTSSMWSWPEDQMSKYASRVVGLQLCNWLRTSGLPVGLNATEEH